MKRLLLPFLALLPFASALAQPFGNEWINYGSQYWAFWVGTPPGSPSVYPIEGLWRIDSTTLANAGFPVATVDARTIQVFGREKQVPVYFPGDSDGVFNGTDFMEFYVPKNDAWLDSALWDDPAHINNPYYSIIGDSIQYFVTYNSSPQVLRVLDQAPGNYAPVQPRQWYWGESIYSSTPLYRKGKRDAIGITTSTTGDGEGYFGYDWVNDGQGSNTNDGPFTIGMPTPYFWDVSIHDTVWTDIVVAGTNSASNQAYPDHHLRLTAGYSPPYEATWTGERTQKFHFPLVYNMLDEGTTNVVFNIIHDLQQGDMQADYPDRQALSYIRMEYQHLFTGFEADDIHMWLPNEAEEAHVSFLTNGPVMYVFGDTVRRIVPEFSGSTFQSLIPRDLAHARTHVYLSKLPNIHPIAAVLPVNGNGYFHDLAATNIDSALVIVTHPKLMDGASQYANYRQNLSYNHYNTLVADVKELYQQFGGGILRHPLGIRRFMGYLLDRFDTPPQGLFLIGKSTPSAKLGTGDNSGYRSPTAADSLVRRMCLVPSMGFPPSDELFTLGLSGQPWDLTIPVGRLAAQTDQQVLDYLDKVQQLESQQQTPAAWMKNILHFRGGFTPSEVTLFDNFLESYRATAEAPCFMGRVTKFVKNPDELISQAAADSVYNLVSEGVTLMTFFAHASGGGFDITIDQPGNYQWNGHYPVMIGNSCYTGNIHLPSSGSASEQFILSPDAGAIAFLASTDLGVTGYLYGLTSNFYQSFSQTNYGKSIGRHIQYLDSVALNVGQPTIADLSSVQQFALHGDPTLIMNSPALPDIELNATDVRIIPDPVTADVDSFKVVVTLRNTGACINTPFSVAVERRMVEENIQLQPVIQQHYMLQWQDTLIFTLPVLVDSGGIGLNTLSVRADLDPDVVNEVEDVTNNEVQVPMLITTGDLLPVDPFNFAITDDPAPQLQASTGDPFAPVRTYVIQIDTTDLYNSPVMEQTTISAPGGVVSWQPPTIYNLNGTQDSLVYYWRCSVDSTGNGGYEWHEFSFQCIQGRRGWGQAHYFQYKDNDYNNIIYDRPERDFDFYTGARQIGCVVRGNNVAICKWTKDLQVQEGGVCGNNGNPPAIHMAVVDPNTFIPWTARWNDTGHTLGANNEGPPNEGCWIYYRPMKNFVFQVNQPARIQNLANALNDSIPDGSYILLYTYKYITRDILDTSDMYQALIDLGASDYGSGAVPDSVPYIFFCQKGNNTYNQEIYGTTLTSDISLSAYLPVTGNDGNIDAPATGPFLNWLALHWRMDPNVPSDSATVTLSTVDDFGNRTPLLTRPSASVDSIDLVAEGISQQDLERLQLQAHFFTDTVFTDPQPAQPVRWQLVGSPSPECAIDPPLGYYVSVDSLYEGQTAKVMVAVHNISDVAMDSLLVGAWVVDGANLRTNVHYKRNAPLPVGGVLRDTIAFDLAGFGGNNALVIEANPRDTLTNIYDQREMYHFNNIATLRFETLRDQENPVLDATFDGMHILDGDIVSARPEIRITLDDENPSLLLDSPGDTANVKMFLLRPGTSQLDQLYYYENGIEQLQFIPAEGTDNICHVIYRPVFGTDGVYTLIARAKDKSSNSSGDHDLTIKFEVVNKPTITEVLNYPNPFTTSTRFVFTLTGSETPSAMRIRIMTISGRVVREIGLDEIGPLRVGRNISEFAWDGTDQFGDKLARGVYLYQVLAQLNGEDIEYRETTAGQYFTKGFGKMYLLR